MTEASTRFTASPVVAPLREQSRADIHHHRSFDLIVGGTLVHDARMTRIPRPAPPSAISQHQVMSRASQGPGAAPHPDCRSYRRLGVKGQPPSFGSRIITDIRGWSSVRIGLRRDCTTKTAKQMDDRRTLRPVAVSCLCKLSQIETWQAVIPRW